MPQEPKKHVSHAIAWSLIALFAGSLAFGIWTYYSQISDIYDNSFNISISHKKTTTTEITTMAKTTTNSATADWKIYTNDTYGFSFKYPEDWTSTKSEGTTESSTGAFGKDLVFKVRYNDPDAVQKSGPIAVDDIYVRVYKKNSDFSNLNSWLVDTFKLPNTELADYEVGDEITLGELKGYYSSIGCCAGVDRNYIVEKGDYVYSLGSSHFDTSITDKNMTATFQKIAPTFQFTE